MYVSVILCPDMSSILKNVTCALGRYVYSAVENSGDICWVGLIHSVTQVSCFHVALLPSTIYFSKWQTSVSNIVISPFNFIRVYLLYCGTLFLGTYVVTCCLVTRIGSVKYIRQFYHYTNLIECNN